MDELEVGLGGLALRGEVVAEEERVRDVERQPLQRAQVHLAAARDADLLVGTDESGHREDAQAASGGELPRALVRGAVEGHEEVDGDRVGAEVAQREESLDELLVTLAETGDEP